MVALSSVKVNKVFDRVEKGALSPVEVDIGSSWMQNQGMLDPKDIFYGLNIMKMTRVNQSKTGTTNASQAKELSGVALM